MQIEQMLNMIPIQLRNDTRFQSWIDTRMYVVRFGSMTDNIPPNYELIVNNSLDSLIEENKNRNNKVCSDNVKILTAVQNYVKNIILEMEKSLNERMDEKLQQTKQYFERMIACKAETLEEALQRIIFWSDIFWQSQHCLLGLGRLDKILDKIKIPDSREECIKVICDFYEEMHRYYSYKSSRVTLGDTGQIIILGGIDDKNTYFYNNLTYLFIEAAMKISLPDPKLMLRVSSRMPDNLLALAVDCIAMGTGSPLLSNDDKIIPSLISFGYTMEDACDYVTSACWEPLSYGRSLEKNNITDLNYAAAFCNTCLDCSFEKLKSFEELIDLYLAYLREEIRLAVKKLNAMEWEANPLMSLFTQGCKESGKDISCGGAIYNDYGILTVGLANVINSLFNIKNLAFIHQDFSMIDLKKAVLDNYRNNQKLKEKLNASKFYGRDDTEVIQLVKRITKVLKDELGDYRNKYNGKVKWGLSSSNYLESGKTTGATLDGRQSGEPLATHISAPQGVAFTELMNFAEAMDCDGQSANGNVVDFLKYSIKNGFFQVQMNVVSSITLVKAKAHPENFPNLIVRVWGFSAYFKDLPEEYQDVLIRRAMESEQVS